jgi:radical SAM superfamily enzyme YgiQ (UPF0313 family)
MARVLLITPYGYENQGIRMLSAVLRRAGHDASTLFLKGWRNNRIAPPTDRELALVDEVVAEVRPDIVGFGFGSPYLRTIVSLSDRLRKRSGAHQIWGGVHPTISPEDCIDRADTVCVGEGESPLLELTRAVTDGGSIDRIPNLWVRANGSIARNALRPLLDDLDELPHAHLFDGPAAFIEDDRLVRDDPMRRTRFYRIHGSRGCPFRCAFCYNSQYRAIFRGLGRYHRIRGVPSILAELTAARRVLSSVRAIKFDDDSFVFPQAWIEEFARDYPTRVGLPFEILLNPDAYDEESLRMLRGAGLYHMQAGIQSASPEELEKNFARNNSPEGILVLARVAKRLGVAITYDVILDNPLATRTDKDATLGLLLRLPRPFKLNMYSLTAFPKSETATQLLRAGIITEDGVEGRATKSFHQYRLSLDYPRAAEDTFYASLISLTSKNFMPRALIRRIWKSDRLRRRPGALRRFAEAANVVKLAAIAAAMLRRKEISPVHWREYATRGRRVIQ